VDTIVGAVATGATVLLSPLIRPWYCRWGATDEELERSLPGDDLVLEPRLETTRGVTIRASASKVWPWLVQMGQGRGGLYSYDRLENLVGCDIHSADRIIAEYQHLAVGDKVRLGPEGYPFFIVEGVEPGRALVLRSGMGDQQETSAVSSWVFFLDECRDGSTRLIARQRFAYEPGLGNLLIWRVFTDPISFVMERKMLLGIKQRAEAAFRQQ
jgi:hypothetical protein